jgi:peptidoglycan/xylan/chitin deacetylase (PgdA/CDA1 family)
MTTDVETTSLELNKPADFMAEKVKKTGLPRLIELYAKYDVRSTFFFTAHILELEPELADMARENGHEIACHGYKHEPEYFFNVLSADDQLRYLKKAKGIIEEAANKKIVSFRAPELLLNTDTVEALEKTKFKYDSSVPPQRFDGPMSRGFVNKMNWMKAPRRPYNMSKSSITKKGDSKIIEIPISSFIFSYMGTTMRVSPGINMIVQKFIFDDARARNTPAVFIIHPTEFIELDRNLTLDPESVQGTFFSGVVRKRIKYKNLGRNAIRLTDQLLKYAKQEGFSFSTIEDYGNKYLGKGSK